MTPLYNGAILLVKLPLSRPVMGKALYLGKGVYVTRSGSYEGGYGMQDSVTFIADSKGEISSQHSQLPESLVDAWSVGEDRDYIGPLEFREAISVITVLAGAQDVDPRESEIQLHLRQYPDSLD